MYIYIYIERERRIYIRTYYRAPEGVPAGDLQPSGRRLLVLHAALPAPLLEGTTTTTSNK